MKTSDQIGTPVKITKFPKGYWMTIARWQGEYRVMTDSKLDIAATLENLKKAQQLLNIAFPQ
ncbi:hypothetical protein [Spirosoma luteum]|uniref:hypothetical protein n=1 Tax=Spirosoma luteum TaxID=431553 RepID=UPI00036212C4|nr:hypothetical protein [Spirosoma luteum]